MYSPEFLTRYARDRMRETQREVAQLRAAPSFRRRLAYKFQALAAWLEPDLKVPKRERESAFGRAL